MHSSSPLKKTEISPVMSKQASAVDDHRRKTEVISIYPSVTEFCSEIQKQFPEFTHDFFGQLETHSGKPVGLNKKGLEKKKEEAGGKEEKGTESLDVEDEEEEVEGKPLVIHRKFRSVSDINRERSLCLLRSLDGYFEGDTTDLCSSSMDDIAKFGSNGSEVWRNEGETVRRSPSRILRPKTLGEIQGVVRRARRSGKRVRAVGRGCSWSDLYGDDGDIWLSMKNFNRVRLDRKRKNVIVQSGATVDDLYRVGRKEGFVVEGVDGAGELTLGGIVATGSFGKGLHSADVTKSIVELSIVDSEGRLRMFSKKNDKEVFSALGVNLGLLGVVYDMTIKVVPERNVLVRNEFSMQSRYFSKSHPSCIMKLREVLRSKDVAEIYWIPFNSDKDDAADWEPYQDELWVRTVANTEHSLSNKNAVARWTTISKWFRRNSLQIASEHVSRYKPEFLATYQKLAFANLKSLPVEQVTTYSEANAGIDQSMLLQTANVEVILPLCNEEDWLVVHTAWTHVIDVLQDYRAQGKYPINIAVRLKLCSSTDALLSPLYSEGVEEFVSIEIMSAKNTADWQNFSSDIEACWQALPGTRFHWAKINENISTEHIWKVYGERLYRFRQVRRELRLDPNNMFANEWLRKTLQLQEERKDKARNRELRLEEVWKVDMAKISVMKLKGLDSEPNSPVCVRNGCLKEKDGSNISSASLFDDGSEYDVTRSAGHTVNYTLVIMFIGMYSMVWAMLFGKEAACKIGWSAICSFQARQLVPASIMKLQRLIKATANWYQK